MSSTRRTPARRPSALRRFLFPVGAATLLAGAVALAAPLPRSPPPRASLTRALGARWDLSGPAAALEAHRRPRTAAGSNFDRRVDDLVEQLHALDGDITIDPTPRGSVHLAGVAADCDQVVLAAQRFAGIAGVNSIVIDTTCRPQD